jgi:hypothetical protein
MLKTNPRYTSEVDVAHPPSFHHYLTGEEGVVEIESHWTGTRREKQGIYLTVR